MNARAIAIALGAALAVSVAVNLFAATAAYTVLSSQPSLDPRRDGADGIDPRLTPRQMIAALDPEARRSVRQALGEAGMRARPDFRQARQARRDAVALAAVDPYDPDRVAALLEQARMAEARGRRSLEADVLTLLGTLEPDQRAVLAPMLSVQARGGRGGAGPPPGLASADRR